MSRQKRQPGQIYGVDGWLVLAESTGDDESGYTHKCGAEIKDKTITLTERDGHFAFSGSGRTVNQCVPYCPQCEEKPRHGHITRGRICINSF